MAMLLYFQFKRIIRLSYFSILQPNHFHRLFIVFGLVGLNESQSNLWVMLF